MAGYTADMNAQARRQVLAQSRQMWQISNTTGNVPQGAQQNIPLRNIGMCKRLLLEVTGTVAAGGATDTQNITKWGLANVLSQVIVTDLANYNRIQTTGWHLMTLASLRRQAVYGAAYPSDSPVNFGSNVQVNNGPLTFNQASGNKTFRIFYECPLAYSDTDLRGAIYSGVVNATWQVSYTLNNNFFVAAGADATLAVYQSTNAVLGTVTGVTVKVHQIFLYQLPYNSQGQPILPGFDLATAYLIQNTGFSVAPTPGIDYPIQYPNFRSILSASFIIDNGGTAFAGTDINYLGIQAASLTYLMQVDANAVSLQTRNTIGDDLPTGSYCLETRVSPVNTTAFGNMQIVFNMSTVNAGFNIQMGWEMMASINAIAGASSLPAN